MTDREKLIEAQKALKFYASRSTWRTATAWTGSAGFGEEAEDRKEFEYYPKLKQDEGKIARAALAKIWKIQ